MEITLMEKFAMLGDLIKESIENVLRDAVSDFQSGIIVALIATFVLASSWSGIKGLYRTVKGRPKKIDPIKEARDKMYKEVMQRLDFPEDWSDTNYCTMIYPARGPWQIKICTVPRHNAKENMLQVGGANQDNALTAKQYRRMLDKGNKVLRAIKDGKKKNQIMVNLKNGLSVLDHKPDSTPGNESIPDIRGTPTPPIVLREPEFIDLNMPEDIT